MSKLKLNDDELKKVLETQPLSAIAEINSSKVAPSPRAVPEKDSELFDEFNKINNEYNFDVNDLSGFTEGTLDLNKLEHKNFTDEELSQKAQDSLSEYYNSSKNEIISKADNDKTVLESNKDKWSESAEKVKQELEGNYEKRKEAASTDAINRGLARSSIIVSKIEAFDKTKLDEYTKIDKELTQSLNNLDSQISLLENAKQSSLKNFDISYASKLNEKINGLKQEQDKKREEVLKYNNEIEKKEKEFALNQANAKQKYEQDLIKKKQDLIKFAEKYGDEQLLEKKYLEKLSLARQYFDKMPKAEAINILLNNGAYRRELGQKWYELYDYINGKRA